MRNPLASDLEAALHLSPDLWPKLNDARIFISGATGFVGCWLLELLLHAVDTTGIHIGVTVLTRDPDAFICKAPHLALHPAITLLTGDACTTRLPAERFSHIICAATPAASPLARNDQTIATGVLPIITQQALDIAANSGGCRLLYISSGAVYGSAATLTNSAIDEQTPCRPDTLYGSGKHISEGLCRQFSIDHPEVNVVICRPFSFVGPWLNEDAGFAVTDFIRDARAGRPITLRGNPATTRSYLYAADLSRWLWHLLLHGRSGESYNVGSATPTSMLTLAETVRSVFNPTGAVHTSPSPPPPTHYVPCCKKSAALGLTTSVDLGQALARTRTFLANR